ncbi:cutinase family protein [Streptomyces bicolor]|uniref:cutinase family protein n=1 Tax=Streptomyces bicolor TaxID=66874 RepID=UPI0004E27C26|nr:PE-PPE domain-containing protein [Streptomyces bicolor]
MSKTSRMARAVRGAAVAVALTAGAVVASPSAAHAAEPDHYYIQIGGTGATPPAPHCTYSYDAANAALQLGDRAIKVCYPASAGPFIGPTGSIVDDKLQLHPEALTAPNYDSSVQQGYREALRVAQETHRAHPDATLTITGYSQGAQVADEVLQTIANGGTDIPRSQVNGVLYADPMQPGTGFTAQIPRGWGVPGFTSPGAGPTEFNGIPVTRYCIKGDPVCDASLVNAPGYFTLHPKYPEAGNVIAQTLGDAGGDGIRWRNADGSPA